MKKNALKLLIFCVTIFNIAIVPADATEAIFSNMQDVQEYLYNNFKDRDSNIQFIYTGSKKSFKDNILQTIKQAYSEDDYTARAWTEIKPNTSISNDRIDTTLDVSYLTSREQEIYIDNEIKSIMLNILKPSMSDIDKIKAINDYLVSRYDYDYSFNSNNPYTALKTGITICQGYSMTAYKMLKYAGIQNRIIVGSLNGESHSWNYVLVNNKWYHLDITNNDSTRSIKYFLVEDNVLLSNKYVWDKNKYSDQI